MKYKGLLALLTIIAITYLMFFFGYIDKYNQCTQITEQLENSQSILEQFKHETDKEKENLTLLNYELIKKTNKKEILDKDGNTWQIMYIDNTMQDKDLLEIIRRIVYAGNTNFIESKLWKYSTIDENFRYSGSDFYTEKENLELISPDRVKGSYYNWPFAKKNYEKQNTNQDLVRLRTFESYVLIRDFNERTYSRYTIHFVAKFINK